MARRLLRIALLTAAAVTTLLVLVVAGFTIVGMPVPATITAEGIPKVSVWRLPTVARSLMGGPVPSLLAGVDSAGRLVLDRGFDVVAVGEDGTLTPTTDVPPASYYDMESVPVPGRPGAFLVHRMRNAAEESDLLLVDGAREDTLLAGAPQVGSMAVAPDGRLVVAFAPGASGTPGTLVRIPLDGGAPGAPQTVATLEGTVRVEAISVDAGTAWVLVSPAETDGKLFAVDLDTGQTSLLLADEAERPVYHANPYDRPGARFRLLDDSTALYVRTGPDSSSLEAEFTRLWLVDLPAGSARRVSPDDVLGDVVDFATAPAGRTVVYLQDERAAPILMAFEPSTGLTRTLHRDRNEPLWPYPGGSFLLDPTNGHVYFQTTSADGLRIRSADPATGASELLVGPEDPGRPRYAFREVEFPTSRSPIGVATGIHAFVYRPLGTEGARLPVVVAFHGGPSMHDMPHVTDPFLAMYLQRGYAVVTVNYRGSSGYGVTFERSDDGIRRREQIDDVLALSDWIRGQPDLDGDRVVLTGGSWGGFMTLTGLIADSTRFRGGFVYAPATLRPDTIAQGGPLAAWNRAEFGDMRDPAVQEEIARVSPALNAGRIRQPIYVFQGVADVRVMAETVRQMRDSIQAAGGTIWYAESSVTGHGPPSSPFEGAYVVGALLEFLDRVMGS